MLAVEIFPYKIRAKAFALSTAFQSLAMTLSTLLLGLWLQEADDITVQVGLTVLTHCTKTPPMTSLMHESNCCQRVCTNLISVTLQ